LFEHVLLFIERPMLCELVPSDTLPHCRVPHYLVLRHSLLHRVLR